MECETLGSPKIGKRIPCAESTNQNRYTFRRQDQTKALVIDAAHPVLNEKQFGRGAGQFMYTLGIGAILRDERPYIMEWIAFHRVVGVEHFVLVDDSSNDGTTDLLGRLAALGLVDHVRFLRKRSEAPQLPAYRSIFRGHGHRFKWLAMVDADEFLVPTVDDTVVPMILSALPDTGAIVLNWATYGSSGAEMESAEPVIERFTRRSNEDWIVDHHTKAIVRTTAYASTGGNPHYFELKPGWQSRHADGTLYLPHPEFGHGLSEALVEAPVRVNHYMIKSRQEFLQRKRPRGRPDANAGKRPLSYFEDHDRNALYDPITPALIKRMRDEINRINALLQHVPFEPMMRQLSSIAQARLEYIRRK